ncbi:MAG: Flp family type IVb pilin [Xanthobacteraceae bacterium]
MSGLFVRLAKDESGATAIEYSLVAGGIAFVILGVVQALGTKVTGLFISVLTALK